MEAHGWTSGRVTFWAGSTNVVAHPLMELGLDWLHDITIPGSWERGEVHDADLDDLREKARRSAKEQERARVVAWLRVRADTVPDAGDMADAIERSEHTEGTDGE